MRKGEKNVSTTTRRAEKSRLLEATRPLTRLGACKARPRSIELVLCLWNCREEISCSTKGGTRARIVMSFFFSASVAHFDLLTSPSTELTATSAASSTAASSRSTR